MDNTITMNLNESVSGSTDATQLLFKSRPLSAGTTMSTIDNHVTPAHPLEFTVFNRTIQIDADITNILIQGDTNSRRITFRLQRYPDGIDLTTKQIRIYYANAFNKTGYSPIQNLVINDDDFTIDWMIDSASTAQEGILTFLLDFYELNDKGEVIYRWQTTPTYINVEKTIEWFGQAAPDDYFFQLKFLKNNPNDFIYENLYAADSVIEIIGREIIMPPLTKIVVEKDTMSRALEFKMRRFFDGADLAQKIIIVKYKNAAKHGDRSKAINVKCDEDYVYFTWAIDGKVTEKEGRVLFGIEVLGYDEQDDFYLWQSIPNCIFVEAGLLIDEDTETPPPSWMQSWELELENIKKTIEGLPTEIADAKYVSKGDYNSDTILINQNFVSLQSDIDKIQQKLHWILKQWKDFNIDGGSWDDIPSDPAENQCYRVYDGGTF